MRIYCNHSLFSRGFSCTVSRITRLKTDSRVVLCLCLCFYIASFQIDYDAHYSQLNFLRTLSNYANQNVTYACRNSMAWEEGQHSIKLMGSNEMEYHTTSKISLRPKVLVNDCMVREPFSYYTRYCCFEA